LAVETAALALLFAVPTLVVSVESAPVRPTTFASAMLVTEAPSPTRVPAVKLPLMERLSAAPTLVSLPSCRTTILFAKSDMELPFEPVSPAGPGGG